MVKTKKRARLYRVGDRALFPRGDHDVVVKITEELGGPTPRGEYVVRIRLPAPGYRPFEVIVYEDQLRPLTDESIPDDLDDPAPPFSVGDCVLYLFAGEHIEAEVIADLGPTGPLGKYMLRIVVPDLQGMPYDMVAPADDLSPAI